MLQGHQFWRPCHPGQGSRPDLEHIPVDRERTCEAVHTDLAGHPVTFESDLPWRFDVDRLAVDLDQQPIAFDHRLFVISCHLSKRTEMMLG